MRAAGMLTSFSAQAAPAQYSAGYAVPTPWKVEVEPTVFSWPAPNHLEKHFFRSVGALGELTKEASMLSDSSKEELAAVKATVKSALQRLASLWPEVAPYTEDPKLQAVVHHENYDEPPHAPWNHDSVSPYEHAIAMAKRAQGDEFLASLPAGDAAKNFALASRKVETPSGGLETAYNAGKSNFSAQTEGEMDVVEKPPALVTPFARADGNDEGALHCEKRCRPEKVQEKLDRSLAMIEGYKQ
mmetsp:Transcript_63702/g.120580  ORF Transcript_63702/g.120580 Transcript_63702/m.120580 type:complete len:243 (+) Transcript_63702:145-873(+)